MSINYLYGLIVFEIVIYVSIFVLFITKHHNNYVKLTRILGWIVLCCVLMVWIYVYGNNKLMMIPWGIWLIVSVIALILFNRIKDIWFIILLVIGALGEIGQFGMLLFFNGPNERPPKEPQIKPPASSSSSSSSSAASQNDDIVDISSNIKDPSKTGKDPTKPPQSRSDFKADDDDKANPINIADESDLLEFPLLDERNEMGVTVTEDINVAGQVHSDEDKKRDRSETTYIYSIVPGDSTWSSHLKTKLKSVQTNYDDIQNFEVPLDMQIGHVFVGRDQIPPEYTNDKHLKLRCEFDGQEHPPKNKKTQTECTYLFVLGSQTITKKETINDPTKKIFAAMEAQAKDLFTLNELFYGRFTGEVYVTYDKDPSKDKAILDPVNYNSINPYTSFSDCTKYHDSLTVLIDHGARDIYVSVYVYDPDSRVRLFVDDVQIDFTPRYWSDFVGRQSSMYYPQLLQTYTNMMKVWCTWNKNKKISSVQCGELDLSSNETIYPFHQILSTEDVLDSCTYIRNKDDNRITARSLQLTYILHPTKALQEIPKNYTKEFSAALSKEDSDKLTEFQQKLKANPNIYPHMNEATQYAYYEISIRNPTIFVVVILDDENRKYLRRAKIFQTKANSNMLTIIKQATDEIINDPKFSLAQYEGSKKKSDDILIFLDDEGPKSGEISITSPLFEAIYKYWFKGSVGAWAAIIDQKRTHRNFIQIHLQNLDLSPRRSKGPAASDRGVVDAAAD